MLEIYGTIFIIVLGSFFHFLYDLTNHNKIVGYFTSVNESTWEHIKLVILPSFLWLITEYHFYFDNNNLFFAKFIGLLVMMITIPVLYYLSKYFIKKELIVVSISIFVIAVILGQILFRLLLFNVDGSLYLKHIGIIGLIIILLVYITNTYTPLKNFLFKDPITNKYGIDGHSKKN